MSAAAPCDRCGRPVAADAPFQVCARCALDAALRLGGEAAPLHEVGDYELEELLARGGMGTVYRARHRTLGRMVALKVLSLGVWADDDERSRFRGEAELAASLEHENIVPIYEVGEHDGQPYYAMRLMQESLAGALARAGELSPAAAAALVATVARAVHWGHQRGVVHRDLKPENILLDAEGRPHVGDFGVSLRLGARPRDRQRTATGAVVGTLGYLAPEQAGAFGGEITVAADVWGLGAVLYRLLCGRAPFPGDRAAASIRSLLEEEPVRPRVHAPSLEPELEIVCLRCLEKDPARRYASALEVAQELERVARGEPILARPAGRWRRLTRWSQRFPARAGALVSAVVFVAALAAGSTLAARAQQRELIEETSRTNAWIARALASAVQLELFELSQQVVRAAQDGALSAALAAGRLELYQPPLAQPFDSFLLLDAQGRCTARWPHSAALVGRDLSFRDYARLGAAASPGHAAITGAYRSEVDGSVRFAVAAPVIVDARPSGVLVGSLAADSTLGALSLAQRDGPGAKVARTVTLLARHGAERSLPASDEEWIVLVHPRLLDSGQVSAVPDRVLERLWREGADPAFADALSGEEVLAGLAPVTGLPFAVLVTTPTSYAVAPNQRWNRRVASAAALAALAGALVLLAVWLAARRGAARRHKPSLLGANPAGLEPPL